MINVKDVYEIDIEDVNQEGQGIGRINGFVVFVSGTLPDEKVKVQIIDVKKSYAEGKVIKLLKNSSHRVEPFCGSYKKCGGCSFQHMSYPAQLEWKKGIVVNALKRIGGFNINEEAGQAGLGINETLGMSVPYKYRNKAQFPVGISTTTGEVTAGFYASRSHDIADIGECGIHDDNANIVKNIVKTFITEKRISVYNEKTGEGLVRHIVTRTGFKTGEVMIILVINGTKIPSMNELNDRLVTALPQIKTIVLNINTRNTNIIFGDKNLTLYGNGYITDFIGKYKYKISPLSFYQVNQPQAEVLYAKALEYAALTGNETVFDLYCGVGTISLYVSERAKKVYGVEIVGAAISDASDNAKINGVTNTEFIEGKAEEVIPELYKKGVTADVVIVDPPRKGCDQTLLETILKMAPKRIVYVSCNPTTLARDLKYLCSSETQALKSNKPATKTTTGLATADLAIIDLATTDPVTTDQGPQMPRYQIQQVQPVDMFPWTGHVETVVLMSRVEK